MNGWERVTISADDMDRLCVYRQLLARRLGEAESFSGSDATYVLPKATAAQVREALAEINRPKWKVRRRMIRKSPVVVRFAYDVLDVAGSVVHFDVSYDEATAIVERMNDNLRLAAAGGAP